MRMTGTRLLHITYKGNAQALVDVMGWQIAMMGLADFEDVTWRSRRSTWSAASSWSPARSPEDFSAYVKSEADGFAKLVREAGIKVE